LLEKSAKPSWSELLFISPVLKVIGGAFIAAFPQLLGLSEGIPKTHPNRMTFIIGIHPNILALEID
jgi:hypothetical protein